MSGVSVFLNFVELEPDENDFLTVQNLILHIEYLLAVRDCVIIPGFGAFLAFNREAVFDMEAGEIIPPVREICFNPAISNNDGLLASSISRRERISYEAGVVEVYEMRDRLRAMLEAEGEVSLGNIGTLTLESGRISFTPFRSPLQNAMRLGMQKVSLPESETSTVGSSRDDVAIDNPDYLHLRISKNALKVAAVIALVIVVGLSFILPYDFSSLKAPSKASVVPVEMPARKEAVRTVSTKRAVDSLVQPEKKVLATETEKKKFHLIVATFHSRKDAEVFLSQHKEDKRLEILPGTKLFRVSVASDSVKSSLLPMMRNREFASEYPGSWVWPSK